MGKCLEILILRAKEHIFCLALMCIFPFPTARVTAVSTSTMPFSFLSEATHFYCTHLSQTFQGWNIAFKIDIEDVFFP